MALSVNVDKKPMLPVVAKAIEAIFHQPKDSFWTGRFMDLFFDGIDIDCTSDEFEATATCAVLGGGDLKAIKPGDKEKFFKFSLFGGVSIYMNSGRHRRYDINSYIYPVFKNIYRQMILALVYIKYFVELKIIEMLDE